MKLSLLLIAFFIHKCSSFFYKDKYGVNISYSITLLSTCRMGEEDVFRRMFGMGLPDCVRECGLRSYCKALSYSKPPLQLCDLFINANETSLTKGTCTYISASDIKVEKKPCQTCALGQVCDKHSKDCNYAECFRIEIDNGIVLGNMNAVGNKIRYKCYDGYKNSNGVKSAVCQENGEWNATAVCKSDCEDPPFVLNGTVTLDSVNDTYVGTATVTCDAWYQTKKSTIACTEEGNWENTTCAVVADTLQYSRDNKKKRWHKASENDCYLNSPNEYAGKRNWTTEGIACQRWDSQSPHSHSYTDPGLFPEATLQEVNNYCRTAGPYIQPWCHTVDSNKEWDYCDVNKCI